VVSAAMCRRNTTQDGSNPAWTNTAAEVRRKRQPRYPQDRAHARRVSQAEGGNKWTTYFPGDATSTSIFQR